MTEDEKISWDDAISGGNYIRLEEGEAKELVITHYKFVKVKKTFQGKESEVIEFQADVLFEDGEAVTGKLFTTSSNRLKKKLRPIFEDKTSEDKVKITVMMVGESFSTQYSVKELKD